MSMKMRGLFFTLLALTLAAPAAQATDTATGDVMGAVISYKVQKNDDLAKIAQKFGVGMIELQAANPGVNPWKPKPGTELTINAMHVLPSDIRREGIVINLETSRLYYFKDDKEVMSFPVASGKPGWETPTAVTQVYNKRKDPTWTPPPRIREENPDLPDFIPPGPNNPLGKYAISLGLNGIMIHGTNAPSSVGKKVSHGCMRMYAKDIERLFKAVKVGTPVLLMKRSYDMGWQENTLFLQMAPRVTKAKKEQIKYKPDLDLYASIQKVAGAEAVIDWQAVEQAVLKADGVPVAVARRPAAPPDTIILTPVSTSPSAEPEVRPAEPMEKAPETQSEKPKERRASADGFGMLKVFVD